MVSDNSATGKLIDEFLAKPQNKALFDHFRQKATRELPILDALALPASNRGFSFYTMQVEILDYLKRHNYRAVDALILGELMFHSNMMVGDMKHGMDENYKKMQAAPLDMTPELEASQLMNILAEKLANRTQLRALEAIRHLIEITVITKELEIIEGKSPPDKGKGASR